MRPYSYRFVFIENKYLVILYNKSKNQMHAMHNIMIASNFFYNCVCFGKHLGA